MGAPKLKYANGSKSSISKLTRATKVCWLAVAAYRLLLTPIQARGFQSWRRITFATTTSYTNPPEAGASTIVTRGVAASVSRDAVFNTNELLELILRHLSMEDLLTARHVNQHWNLLIIRSPRLKQILFLRQSRKYRFWVFDLRTEAIREYQLGDHKRFGPAWNNRQNVALPSIINPLLIKQNGPGIKGSLAYRAKYCESMTLRASPDLKNQDSLIYEMYLCLPAPREVEFKIYYHKRKPQGRGRVKYYGDDWIRGKVSNKCGVTLGDVIEKFLSAVEKHAVNEKVEDYVICEKSSVFWLFGHIFPTEGEWTAVKARST